MKNKNSLNEIKSLISEELLNDYAVGHLEAWQSRYVNRNKKQVLFDLEMNHDISLEIEKCEEITKRKLTSDEYDWVVSSFNKLVVKNHKK